MADRQKPLTASQASNCENAREPECKCRCGGAGHGAKRAPAGKEDDRTWYEQLPETDPHHLPSDVERKHLKRQRKLVNQRRTYVAMCRASYGDDHDETINAQANLADAETELRRIEDLVLGRRRGQAPALHVSNTQYDIWWCAKEDKEWKVPSRPHNPKCPTCGEGGWWRRFEEGPPYAIECGGSVEPQDEEPDIDDEPPPDYGPPGSGAIITEYP